MGIESPIHLIFIGIVALLVLGPRRLPELARRLGDGVREFRDAIDQGQEGHEAPSEPPAAATATATAPPPAPSDATQPAATTTVTDTDPSGPAAAAAAPPVGEPPLSADATVAAPAQPPAPGEAPPQA